MISPKELPTPTKDELRNELIKIIDSKLVNSALQLNSGREIMITIMPDYDFDDCVSSVLDEYRKLGWKIDRSYSKIYIKK